VGRKTWESLPDAFRPLPGRRNIVISRNPAYDAPGATLAGSLEEAVRLTQDDAEVFVIGGAEIYRQALPLAQRLYLTEVAQDFAADAFFPEFSASDWTRNLALGSEERRRPRLHLRRLSARLSPHRGF
jgi:dihydrofolate reductase